MSRDERARNFAFEKSEQTKEVCEGFPTPQTPFSFKLVERQKDKEKQTDRHTEKQKDRQTEIVSYKDE